MASDVGCRMLDVGCLMFDVGWSKGGSIVSDVGMSDVMSDVPKGSLWLRMSDV
ncbi:MAG: hypothetical protein IPH45_08535 [Bacteroidales bacterium]|nr:hypothetical protein [Bacteroidales bacterium]